MIVSNILGYFCRNKQNSYAALIDAVSQFFGDKTIGELVATNLLTTN